jgi:hypothetical protein
MRSTAALREAWKEWACKEARMILVDFGPDRIRVVPPTKDAWTALAQVMADHDYRIRPSDTDSYNCRPITGGTGLSLHAYGIALDVNWDTNPYLKTANGRTVRFSSRRTQDTRAEDVKVGVADTDMTSAMIDDIRAIETVDSKAVFAWGGDFKTSKDAMHFQIDLTPDELARGIDWSTHTVTVVAANELPPAFVKRGDVSVEVEYYQRKLVRLSPKPPGAPDGKYGKDTAASVLAFQRSRTPMVREGTNGHIIGPWTRDELDLADMERLLVG